MILFVAQLIFTCNIAQECSHILLGRIEEILIEGRLLASVACDPFKHWTIGVCLKEPFMKVVPLRTMTHHPLGILAEVVDVACNAVVWI